MARLSRFVAPGLPHHVVQRGNRQQQVFFSAADSVAYLELLAEFSAAAGTEVWAYCLMPTHLHLILAPRHEDGLRATLGETHRRYTRRINRREGWRGHLWQERFHSFAFEDARLVDCVRYVERNPVRAGLAPRAAAWRWSSARAHLAGRDDAVVRVGPLLDRCPDWAGELDKVESEAALLELRRHVRGDLPLGSEAFIAGLEAQSGRRLRPGRRGRPRKSVTA